MVAIVFGGKVCGTSPMLGNRVCEYPGGGPLGGNVAGASPSVVGGIVAARPPAVGGGESVRGGVLGSDGGPSID